SAVCPALEADGFTDVEVFGPHAEPDPDFTNVPGHVSNPENAIVFEAIIERAKEVGADVVMATDPDADRLGCAAPRTSAPGADWDTITGNQIGSLLSDFLLDSRKAAGTLTPDNYLVKTLVTTELMRRIAEQYNVRCVGDLLVGFKWIGGVMDDEGPAKFVFGTEESHGYLVGQYARDKDAAVAAMLFCELAARAKAEGKSVHEKLDDLFVQFGCHAERTISITMPGSEGMTRMKTLMERFRSAPPESLGGMKVTRRRDYLSQTVTDADGTSQPLDGPQGDMVILDLAEESNFIAVRPSGTEPKVKFYMFAFVAAELIAFLEESKTEMNARLDRFEQELNAFAESV
ncbi:MAG: phospho-sugar mutase, partial [Planctomycetales bacterium]